MLANWELDYLSVDIYPIAKKELASTNQNQKMSGGALRRHSSSGFMSQANQGLL